MHTADFESSKQKFDGFCYLLRFDWLTSRNTPLRLFPVVWLRPSVKWFDWTDIIKRFFYVQHNLYWLRFQRLLAFPSVVLFYSKALLPGTSISKVKFCYFSTSFVAFCVFDTCVCIWGEELCFVRYRVFGGRIKTDVCWLVLRVPNYKLKNSLPYIYGNVFPAIVRERVYKSRSSMESPLVIFFESLVDSNSDQRSNHAK